MLTIEQHLDNLIRHIDLVRSACVLLGKKFINQGKIEFGRILISKGFVHDASKFSGIEWDYLHAGSDVSKDRLTMAIKQHVTTNSHHPEFWGGVEFMPAIALCECVCDWYARSQEFGTDFRAWIQNTAVPKYNIDTKGKQYDLINKYVDMLLDNQFVT